MFYLIIATLTSVAIIVTFRIFERFKIDNAQAITFNYLVASSFGFFSQAGSFKFSQIPDQTWFYSAFIVGLTLIIAFHLFALSAQYAGIAITAISSRMSVIIPVTLGFLIFGDTATPIKILGIVVGLAAFYFTFKKDKPIIKNTGYTLLPILLLLAVGTNDSMMKVAEHYFIQDDFVVFLASAFGVALILGILLMLIRWKTTLKTFAVKNLVAGFILGLLNWYSTLYFLKGLDIFQVSFFVPIFNIGVVALSALTGYFAFKEKLSKLNWFGIGLAIIAILLIAGGMA
jgi:drug/metabolite transporter (DMT)-like permease